MELPHLDPNQFASLIAQASDDQIAEGLAQNGDAILAEIFERWPAQLDREKSRDVNSVIEWRVTRASGQVDRWQISIRNGECSVARDGDADPEVTFDVSDLDYMKLIAGVESGPKLFVFGRLRIHGNLMLAARVQGLFDAPKPE